MPNLLELATRKPREGEFDPEGAGFDHKTAAELIQKFPLTVPRPESFQGDVVANDGAFQAWVWHPELDKYLKHSSSRDPRTGMVLKGAKHPTFQKAVDADERLGFTISKGKGGRLFSLPVMPGAAR